MRENVETVSDFTVLGSKITADGDCSHKIKRHFFLGRIAKTKLDSVLKKQRHHFADKSPYSQSYDFPCSHVRRRQWHPTPVLLPGKSHGWRSLVGCSPWGREESDTTERLHFHFSPSCIGEGNGTHSSMLAWRIPGMGEPGGLPSMGSHRVGHD